VLVQTNAGAGIGCADERYRAAGAEIAGSAKEIFDKAEMIVKVKEPQPAERAMLKEGQVLFTYLHLAPDPDQTRDLVESGVVGVAYETVVDSHGGLPLLAPMSQVAGRLAIQAGAHALEKAHGGKGILLANMPGAVPNTSTYALNNVTLR
jgi:alanine dehydrogenase